MKIVGCSILFVVLGFACQKQVNISSTNEAVMLGNSSAPIGMVNQASTGTQGVAQIPYPTTTNITALFQMDKYALQDLVNSNNEQYANAYVLGLADRIAGFYYHNRGIDLRSDFVDNPVGIITVGLFSGAREAYFGIVAPPELAANSSKASKLEVPMVVLPSDERFDCFLTAIGSFIMVTEARQIWKSIVAGAAEQTVIAPVKAMARRVATVITVVIAVYEIGDCLDWWD